MIDPKLSEWRAQIDALDVEILDRLKRRSAIVAQVGEHKRESQKERCFIRPGREAEMVRRMAKADVAPFPSSHLAAIWRLMIAGSTNIEQAITASVLVDKHNRDLFWMAREYFGPSTQISSELNAARVIGEVAEGKIMVGFLPMPSEAKEPWWTMLAKEKKAWPRVFARAPLMQDKQVPNALLIGDVPLEASGDDVTLVVLEMKKHVSKAKLQATMNQAGLKATAVVEAPSSEYPGLTAHLYEVEGFIQQGNKALKDVRKALEETIETVHVIGSYAAQIVPHP